MSEQDRIRDYFETAKWRSSPGRVRLMDERTAMLHEVVSEVDKPIAALSLCDVGCGAGSDLVGWCDLGIPESQLSGTELVPARAEAARRKLPEADIRLVDGFELPFASGSFDVCTASLVLSTVRRSSDRQRLLVEMARVTAAGGMVIVYDFAVRKPWNRNVAPVSSRDLRQLWRAADSVRKAAPLLPALDLAMRLPGWARAHLIAVLPRTHRVWAWRVTSEQDLSSAE